MRILFALTGLLISSTAFAQPGQLTRPERVGFELAGGLQAGRIICESEGDFCNDFTEAGGVNLNAAYFLNPTFGITFDVWAMAHTEDNFTFAHYINTVGVKWRPLPIVTLTGGIGVAHATLSYDGFVDVMSTSEDGFAVLVAAAVDLVRSQSWALSLEARFGSGFYGEGEDGGAEVTGRNVGVGAAFTFFGF
ncbi:MAG: outer membrane beta-barrel protein [Kofleriaceae bacterium]